ncbi:unnamed protein product [Linum tenue]|uniref:Aminotransferase-like plant mobile domain-containing protein n=1 Tax=Linum tenue TaxID=586396 RepID=A0AAV0NHP2_9ROSI|nr:unnamed protein product [Linum tenue]
MFPDKVNRWIQGMWLSLLLDDWDEIGGKSWGSAVLAGIYRELCTCSRLGAKQAGGAMFVLQLWAWEHLPMFAPRDPREFWGPDEELRELANPPMVSSGSEQIQMTTSLSTLYCFIVLSLISLGGTR